MNMVVERVALSSPEAQRLIARLNEELSALYPEAGATHFALAENETAADRGGFFVVRLDRLAVGCGALRLIEPGVFELKRMFVLPEMRGRGLSKVLLQQLLDEARVLAAKRVVLETGIRQSAAIALYEKTGFERIDPFGEYAKSATTSVCYALDL